MNRKTTPRKISILIVDDHALIRYGLRTMLEKKNQKYVFKVEECESAEEAIETVRRKNFDTVLMDYQMPKLCGPEAIRQLLGYRRELKIVAISNYDELAYVKEMVDSGARGYILKDVGLNELFQAIDTILSGELFYSTNVALKLTAQRKNQGDMKETGTISLTKREIEVLRCIMNEESSGEIALKMNIAKRTVDAHRHNLIRKTKVKNIAGLVRIALKLKIIT